jgi:hypothetical protein
MCFDTQSSLLAWSLSYSISVFLYLRNRSYDRWNSAFIMTFATIQLLEAGLWVTLEKREEKTELNDLLTRLVLLTLVTQPLVQSYMGYRYTKEISLAVMSWVFLGLLIWAFWRVIRSSPGQFSTLPGPNGHLIWDDKRSPSFLGGWWVGILYLAGLFIPLFFMKHKGLMLIGVGVATAIFSLLAAPAKEFSSYWCYTTVIYALVALFI